MGKVFGMMWMFIGILLSGVLVGVVSSAMTVNHLAQLDVSSLNQLSGQKVCFVPGVYEDYMAKNGAHVRGRKAADIIECVQKLQSGDVDAILYDKPNLDRYVNQGRLGDEFAVSPAFVHSDYGVAFTEDSELTHIFSTEILKVIEDSDFVKGLRIKWLGELDLEEEEANEEPIEWIWVAITTSLFGLLMVAKCLQMAGYTGQKVYRSMSGMPAKAEDKRASDSPPDLTPAHSMLEKVLNEGITDVKNEMKLQTANLRKMSELHDRVEKTAAVVSDVQSQLLQQAKSLADMQDQIDDLRGTSAGLPLKLDM
jgi:hypothetical protein